MINTRKIGTLLCASVCAAIVAGALAPAASANIFELTYTGSFTTLDALNPVGAAATDFAGTTPFTATAQFDDASTNLVSSVKFPPVPPNGPVPGFVAYSPISASLTVDGQTYNVETANQDPIQGVSVAVFDNTTPYMAGHYAIGFLQNPVADGAGFIGDWLSASPTFSATHLVPTTFTDYQGVGYGSGPDPHNGNPPAVVPIPLTDAAGKSYLLTLGNYDENAPPVGTGTVNTASLQAVVPEVSPLGFLALGLGLMAVVRRRRA